MSATAPDTTGTTDPSEKQPPVATQSVRRRSPLRVLLRLLLWTVLLLLLVTFWVLGTQSGLRSALSVVERLAPDLLQVQQVQGRILGNLHLRGLSVQTPGLALKLGSLDLRWSPLKVVTGTLRISELSARGLDIATAPAEGPTEPSDPIQLPQRILLPVRIELEQALVEQFSIGELNQDSRFRIDRVELAASLSGSQVTVKTLTLALPEPRVHAEAQGKIELIDNYPVGLGLTWDLSQEPALELAGAATIDGDLHALRIAHDLTGSAQIKLRALVREVLERPAWEGELHILGADLPAIHPDLPALNLRGDLTTSGDLDDARIRGDLLGTDPNQPDLGRLRAKLDLGWRDRTLDLTALELAADQLGTRLAAAGKMDLSHPAGKIDLEAGWEQLHWPPAGEPIAESKQGEIQVHGTLDAFDYRLASELRGRDLPETKLRLTGKGNQKAAQIDELLLETLGGHLRATATLGWNPTPTWDAELTITDINPGKHWPEWGGVLNGRILSTGAIKDGNPELDAQLESLTGKLRDQPVDAAAQVRMEDNQLRIQELRIASGPSNIQATGSVGEQLDLALSIRSPDLGTLLPDAQGNIRLDGTATGALKTPAVKLDLSADGVAVAGQGVRSFKGSAQIDLTPGGPIEIDLTGQDLTANGIQFESLRIQGNGDMGSHRLSAQAEGAPLALDLQITGGLQEENTYAGRLEGLELRTQAFGNWRLRKSAPVVLAGARIDVGPICISDEAGSGGCVGFEQRAPGNWNAALDLDRLAFHLFKGFLSEDLLLENADLDLDRLAFQLSKGFLPEDLLLAGEAKVKADFQATDGVLIGNARLQIPDGTLKTRSGGDELLNFTSAQLAIDAEKNGLRARLTVPLKDLGDLSGEAALPGWSLNEPARPNQPLRGDVKARIQNFDIISRLIPDITNPTGNLNLAFKLGGTLAAPGLSGSARIAGGGLEVPLIGLEVRDLTFNAEAERLDRIRYRGNLEVGGGNMRIEGHSRMGAEGLATHISAKGDRLKVADSKEYFALAGTDIQVEIGSAGTKISGEITVPEARIQPRNLPAGAVLPSPDVVIATKGQGAQPGHAMSIDLNLALGKKVTIDAFGLESNIQGELAVQQLPGKEILGNGQLEIVDGTYRIPVAGDLTVGIGGAPLEIEQGFLNYAQSPIANPYLVFTAQREGGDTTAGLRVFGTIRNPKLTFFSATDPGMSQSEITTYLVTGIPPKRDGQQDQAVSLGTYVAPKLFAEYDHSLGDEADKIKLRYDINDWVELQTETGDSQGGDIFLKIEN